MTLHIRGKSLSTLAGSALGDLSLGNRTAIPAIIGGRHSVADLGAAMGTLMLKCSTTGLEFSTNIELEQDSFRELPDVVTRALCPHCGRLHSMFTHETRWADGVLQLSWKIAARHQVAQGIVYISDDARSGS
jgi:hypothetical protein